MQILITYYHQSSKAIAVSFSLEEKGEEAFAVGFGKTAKEAEDNLLGWFDKSSEQNGKSYRCDETMPYIAVFKQKNGQKIRINETLNILEEVPIPKSSRDWCTVRSWYF